MKDIVIMQAAHFDGFSGAYLQTVCMITAKCCKKKIKKKIALYTAQLPLRLS